MHPVRSKLLLRRYRNASPNHDLPERAVNRQLDKNAQSPRTVAFRRERKSVIYI